MNAGTGKTKTLVSANTVTDQTIARGWTIVSIPSGRVTKSKRCARNSIEQRRYSEEVLDAAVFAGYVQNKLMSRALESTQSTNIHNEDGETTMVEALVFWIGQRVGAEK